MNGPTDATTGMGGIDMSTDIDDGMGALGGLVVLATMAEAAEQLEEAGNTEEAEEILDEVEESLEDFETFEEALDDDLEVQAEADDERGFTPLSERLEETEEEYTDPAETGELPTEPTDIDNIAEGVFHDMQELEEGDTIEAEFVDRRDSTPYIRQARVAAVKTVEEDDIVGAVFLDIDDDAFNLNALVWATGHVSAPGGNTYPFRLAEATVIENDDEVLEALDHEFEGAEVVDDPAYEYRVHPQGGFFVRREFDRFEELGLEVNKVQSEDGGSVAYLSEETQPEVDPVPVA
ncbi:hypothetical protein [Natronococcus roseus]|uniref:hypothetical protein n=1 Tax=Natronococcus roseus TaxID=1052014 RepID=UPI00374C95F0